jgi:hypothetical protein
MRQRTVILFLEFDSPIVSDVIYVEGIVGDMHLESVTDAERSHLVSFRSLCIGLGPNCSTAIGHWLLASLK